jgi:hypothetical protein
MPKQKHPKTPQTDSSLFTQVLSGRFRTDDRNSSISENKKRPPPPAPMRFIAQKGVDAPSVTQGDGSKSRT